GRPPGPADGSAGPGRLAGWAARDLDIHSVHRPSAIRYAAPASRTVSKARAECCSSAATPNAAAAPQASAAAAAPRAAATAARRPCSPLRTTNIMSGPGTTVSATDTSTKVTIIAATHPVSHQARGPILE